MSSTWFSNPNGNLSDFLLSYDEKHPKTEKQTVAQRIKQAQERIKAVREFCKKNNEKKHETPFLPSNYLNLENLRATMDRQLINVTEADEESIQQLEIDTTHLIPINEGANQQNNLLSPLPKQQRVSKSPSRKSKAFFQRMSKKGSLCIKPSAFSIKKSPGSDEKATPKPNNLQIPNSRFDLRKRNSDLISNFAQHHAPKLSLFGPNLMSNLNVGQKANPQRDSIYVEEMEKFGKRVSKILSDRNSLFKFEQTDFGMGIEGDNNEEALFEVYSDIQEDENDPYMDEVHVTQGAVDHNFLRVQYLQHQDAFLSPLSNGVDNFNIFSLPEDMDEEDDTSEEDEEEDEDEEQTLSQRIWWFMSLDTEMRVNIISKNGQIVKKALGLSSPSNDVYFTFTQGMSSTKAIFDSVSNQDSLLQLFNVETKNLENLDSSKRARLKRGLQYIGQAFGEAGSLPRFGMSLVDSSVVAHKLDSRFLKQNICSTPLVQFQELDNSVKIVPQKSNQVYVNLELGRMIAPISLNEGTEIYFNDVDGIQVKTILKKGYSDEQLEEFIAGLKDVTWVDCLNRVVSNENMLKLLCKAFLNMILPSLKKENGQEASLEEQLTKCFKKVVKSKELISKLFLQQKKYLIKKIRAERPALIKIGLIRNYEALNLKKEIVDMVFFRATPFTSEGQDDSSINTTLKASVFRDVDSVIFGQSIQRNLPEPKLRNELQKTHPLMNISTSYDCGLGYSEDTSQFFLRWDTQLSSKTFPEEANDEQGGVPSSEFTQILDTVPSNSSSIDRPKEGPWMHLQQDSSYTVPNGTLVRAGQDFLRLYSDKVKVVFEEQE